MTTGPVVRERRVTPEAEGGRVDQTVVGKRPPAAHRADAGRPASAPEPEFSPPPEKAPVDRPQNSPAGEAVRLLLPEARWSAWVENAAPDVPPLAGSESPLAQAPAPRVDGPETASIRSARVIDAHESFSTRLGGGIDESAEQSPAGRLARVLSSSVGPRTSYLKLQLEPPSLGQLRLEVRMNQDALSIRVQAETAAVRNLVSERIAELKTSLQQHGLQLDRVTVELKPPAGEWRGAEQDWQQRQASGQGHPPPHEQPHRQGHWSGQTSGQGPAHSPGELNRPARDEREERGVAMRTESSVDLLI